MKKIATIIKKLAEILDKERSTEELLAEAYATCEIM